MLQQTEKQIYIPQRLEKLFFNGLPLSDTLASFLAQNDIATIGDLRKIKGETLNQILKKPTKPFPQLRQFILAFQDKSDDKISLIIVERAVSSNDGASQNKNTAGQVSSIDKILSRTIFVPLPARKWAISHLPISPLLVDKLEKCRYVKLSDLNGTTYSRFADEKSFEQKDVLDLYLFLSQLQSEEVFRSIAETVAEIVKTKAEQPARLSSTAQIKHKVASDAPHQSLHNQGDKSEIIQTPASLRALPIEHLEPSEKLKAAFKKKKLLFVGQLDGLRYSRLRESFGLTEADVEELQNLIKFASKFGRYTTFKSGFDNIRKAAARRKENEEINLPSAQNGAKRFSELERKSFVESKSLDGQKDSSQSENFAPEKFIIPTFSEQKFIVPPQLKNIPLDNFSLTIKLRGMLGNFQVAVIGDLEKISYKDFVKARFCTSKERIEFRNLLLQLENFQPSAEDYAAEESQPKIKTLDAAELMKFINEFLSNQPHIYKNIFSERFGGADDEEILTFDALAAKYGISRERAYQIYVKTLNKLKDDLQTKADDALKNLRDECVAAVCPLTPKFLVEAVEKNYELFQFPAGFYIRLFGALYSSLPILPEIENRNINLKTDAKNIEQEITSFLYEQMLPVSLPKAFNRAANYHSNRENFVSDFFEAIQSVKFNLMTTDNPKELFIELRESV